MARCAALVAVSVAALVVSAGVAAKGPTAARIDGPGLAGSLVLEGFGKDGTGPLGALTADGGFLALVFGEVPDARLPGRPAGDLGPRYLVDYTVPAGVTEASHVRQEIYPYASGGPVLYLPPGQVIFNGGEVTAGGWIRAPETLRAALVAAGLPSDAPGTASGGGLGGAAWLVAPAALLAAGGLTLLVRRRSRRQGRAQAVAERSSASA